MNSSPKPWKSGQQAGHPDCHWNFSTEGGPFSDTWAANSLFHEVPNQPLSGMLSDQPDLSTYDDTAESLFPEASTGRTAIDPFDPCYAIEPHLVNSVTEALGAVYSPAVPAPQTVNTGLLLPSMVEEARRLLPDPHHNTASILAAGGQLGQRVHPQILQKQEGLKNPFAGFTAQKESEDLFQLLLRQAEQRVPVANSAKGFPFAMPSAATQAAWMKDYLEMMQQNQNERNVPVSNDTLRINVSLDGTILSTEPAERFSANNYNSRHPLSKRFVRHVDQSQGYSFKPPNLVPSNSFSSLYDSLPDHAPRDVRVPPPIPTPVAGLTPLSSSKDVSFSESMLIHQSGTNGFENNGDFGDGSGQDGFGGSGGGGRGGGGVDHPESYTNSVPSHGMSPQPCTLDDADTLTTRRSRRQKAQRQFQHQQEQQPVESDATDGTVSRLNYSYYSDGESSQDAMAFDKLNPDDITFEELSKLFNYNQNEAAEKMGIGSTTLKKVCRRLGLTRWPSRHLKSLIKLRETLNNDAEITERFPENERRQALTEIEESLRGRDVSKFLKDFRQKVFKNTHTLKTKNGGVNKK